MTLVLEPTTTVPLRTDANGVIRVGIEGISCSVVFTDYRMTDTTSFSEN